MHLLAISKLCENGAYAINKGYLTKVIQGQLQILEGFPLEDHAEALHWVPSNVLKEEELVISSFEKKQIPFSVLHQRMAHPLD